MQTIKQILEQAKLGDKITDGTLCWQVNDLDYDGAVVAIPIGTETGFELWSCGVESVAVIPGLRIIKE